MYLFVLIILVYNTLAYVIYETESPSPNVGTVLFTKLDLNKKRWNKNMIKLLLARKHLQRLIPPPHLIEAVNEDYLDNLLAYYKESYRTVKREIKNRELINIMNIALSDALGGYLKVWVLPLTKYAYYGGAISMQKAVNIFQVFEDIKRNLKTDGRRWRNPNENLLKSVAIEVISQPHISLTRSMKDPCNNLAYYEKSGQDLTVPLPMINWDILPITILVPLKNQSLVPISSINSSKILLNYYNIAENCMQAQNPKSSENFKQKFQSWLAKDVAPHLNDNNLYIAFGSVLSLMNDTKKSYGSFSKDFNDRCEKLKSKTISVSSFFHKSQNKYFIITIIFLVEVIWCLPSLFYIIHVRKRKRSKKIKTYICNLFKRNHKNDNNKFPYFKQNNKNKNNNFIYRNINNDKDDRGMKLAFKPRMKTLEVDVQYPSCDSKYVSIKSSKSNNKNISSNQPSVANKVSKTPSLKKIFPDFDSMNIPASNNILNESSYTQSLDKVTKNPKTCKRDLEPMRTLTVIEDEQTIKEINYSQESTFKEPQAEISKSQCKCCISVLDDKNPQCACSTCSKEEVIMIRNKNKSILPKPNPKLTTTFEKCKTKERKSLYETVMHTKVNEKAQTSKQTIEKHKIKTEIEKTPKLKNKKPLLRIRIERPQTEIKVGITSHQSSKSRPREQPKIKPSKIPRLAIKKEIKEDEKHVKTTITPIRNAERLKIDKTILGKKNLKEKALDDTAIKRTATIDKKLNVTL
ncbi:unnamed protein product [Euphydryas editha]|uniref:Uncharacterized protein n=1 Tax=Euphydryas editha TaxID=104508 RepID=A0AAU9TP14_EUPED|nr:unnamed protein product [Euphydryas editha]